MLDSMVNYLQTVLIWGSIITIILYIALGIFLTRLHKLLNNGKGSALAWIPFCNIYLLGKLAINKLFGWGLLIINILNSVSLRTSSFEIDFSSSITKIIYDCLFVLSLVLTIVKYIKLYKANGKKIPKSPEAIKAEEEYQKHIEAMEKDIEDNNIDKVKAPNYSKTSVSFAPGAPTPNINVNNDDQSNDVQSNINTSEIVENNNDSVKAPNYSTTGVHFTAPFSKPTDTSNNDKNNNIN